MLDKSTLAVIILLVVVVGAIGANYYSRLRRRSRRRQAFYEKLRQHQEAIEAQSIPSEEPGRGVP
jgi:cell division protein FtsB